MAKSKDAKPKHDASAGGPRYHGGFQPSHRSGAKGGMHGKRGSEAGPGGSDSGNRHAHKALIGTRNPHRAGAGGTVRGG